MALRAVFAADRITRVLFGERGVSLRVTARAKLRRFLHEKISVVTAVHVMACCAAVGHRLMFVRAFELLRVVAFDTQSGNLRLQQSFRLSAMRIMAIEALARARRIVYEFRVQMQRIRAVARRTKRSARVFKSQRPNLAVRQVTRSAIPFFRRFVCKFTAVVFRVVALEAVFLFAETGSAFHLSLCTGVSIQREKSQSCEYDQ